MLKVTQFSPSAEVRLSESRLVLPGNLDAEVARLWQAEQALRGGKALVNGEIFSAVEISPDTIVGRTVEYRHLIAQRAKPELFEVLNVRPVAVSGLFECAGGVVFGRRSGAMTQDAGLWELVPSGGLDTSKATAGGKMDYCAQILTELNEEVGICADVVTDIRPFCLVDDLDTHVIDIGISLTSPISGDEVISIHRAAATKEYDELLIVSRDEVSQLVEDKRRHLVVVSAALIDHIPRASS